MEPRPTQLTKVVIWEDNVHSYYTQKRMVKPGTQATPVIRTMSCFTPVRAVWVCTMDVKFTGGRRQCGN